MCRIAAKKSRLPITVDDRELKICHPNYTCLTLQTLRADYGDIIYVVGSDSFLEIFDWREPLEIVKQAEILVIPRAGYTDGLDAQIEKWHGAGGRVTVSAEEIEDISSTEIRIAAAFGRASEFTPVGGYIKRRKLYGEYNAYVKCLKSYGVTDKRLDHTYGVAVTAAKLAKRYGADITKTVTAAILHDVGKKAAKTTPDGDGFHKEVRHAFLGAEIAQSAAGITDSEILDAIRYHTTGRPDMGLIEKIIYLADCIEPGRPPLRIDGLKKIVYNNLDEAMRAALGGEIERLSAAGKEVYYLTEEALEFYKS